MTKSEKMKKVSGMMKKLDFCMMMTVDGRGTQYSRPMSNNRQVEFDGDNWFFSFEDTNKVKHIHSNPKVSLIYQGDDMQFLQLYGTASIVKQKSKLEEHWVKGLEQWFPEGVETPGLCLLHVKASKAQFWHKADEGVIDLD